MTRCTAVSFAGLLLLVSGAAAARTQTSNEGIGDFVAVVGGAFSMGADPSTDRGAFANERWSATSGEGSVVVPTYYIARHVVTVAEFAAFARETNWRINPRAIEGPLGHPVTFVSWPDALAYCRWLESSLKSMTSTPSRIKELLNNGWRVTLPNEAEWEKAGRVLDRGQYSWGQVSEWTRSPYQPYPYDPSDDRANLEADALWVIRGGVVDTDVRTPRVTARTGADPGARRPFIGFRVAISQR
jgi:formylglycine-generating enzyme required for sulfatase activity